MPPKSTLASQSIHAATRRGCWNEDAVGFEEVDRYVDVPDEYDIEFGWFADVPEGAHENHAGHIELFL